MLDTKYSRLQWLARRLSRISPAEVPYRVAGVLRGAAQARGWFDAASVPAMTATPVWGRPWVAVPPAPDVPAVLAAADSLKRDGVPVFDLLVPLDDGALAWNTDPRTGCQVALDFGLGIDFRHMGADIDVKYLWELNRHVWWVTLAQAYSVTREPRDLRLLGRLIAGWLDACPYGRGVNWASPVEHGIRLINWSIVWHLIGGAASPLFADADGARLQARWLDSVYQHMRFASDNYSFHSSSDNHLIGEAAGLFVASHTWDLWDAVRPLRARAKRILEQEMLKQFAPDGVNLEQAMCYHKFSLEFLAAAALAGAAAGDHFSAGYMARMEGAVVFLAAMMDCRGHVPPIGDADDGLVFGFAGAGSPYLALLRLGQRLFATPALGAKLAALAPARADDWTLTAPAAVPTAHPAPQLPTAFAQGGYLILGRRLHRADELRVTFDVGALGYNKISGHGHADSLALLLSAGGDDFLIDPGTYCYNAAPALRHYFRGTSAHNTACLDHTDQSLYGGSFLWLRDVVTTLHDYQDDGSRVSAEASHDGYARLPDPVRHRRRVMLDRDSGELVVEDRFDCRQRHHCALHWHFAPQCQLDGGELGWTASRAGGQLAISMVAPGLTAELVRGRETPPLGWVSDHFYQRQPGPVLRLSGMVDDQTVIITRLAYRATVAVALQGATCASGLN